MAKFPAFIMENSRGYGEYKNHNRSSNDENFSVHNVNSKNVDNNNFVVSKILEGSFNPYGNGQPTKKNNKKGGGGDVGKQIADLKNTMKGIAKTVAVQAKPLVKQGLLSTGRALGSYAGSQVGMPILGQTVGEKVFAHISKAIGSGDYEIMGARTNSLINNHSQIKNDGFRFVHREYIRDIVADGTASFNLRGFACNPGDSYVFPYLYAIAQQFEEFRINGMIFEFVSTSSNYAATTTLGTVIASAEYNAASTPYVSKVQMENANNAVQCRLDGNLMFGLECNEFPNERYYVNTPASVATPVNLTTPANFYLATVIPASVPNNTILGELWVSYDVTFFRPRPTIYSNVSFGLKYAHLRYAYSAPVALTDSPMGYAQMWAGATSISPVVQGISGFFNSGGFQISNLLKDDIFMVVCTITMTTTGSMTAKSSSSNTNSANMVVKAALTTVSGGTTNNAVVAGSNSVGSAIAQTVSTVYTNNTDSTTGSIAPNFFTITTGATGTHTAFGDLFIYYLGNQTNSALI